MKIKGIIANFIKNVFAYALPVAVLQFLVQPYIAAELGDEENGLFLALIAVNYFLNSITASMLMQTRMLQDERYKALNLIGDYNILLGIMSLINSLIMCGAVIFYMGPAATVFDILACVVIGLLFLIHDYVLVQYRLNLDFTKILISNIVLCLGYGAGVLCYRFCCPRWQVIFIVAYGICEIYDLLNTTCWRDPLRKTPLFQETTRRYLTLAGASVLTNLVTYGDRLLLYPVLDGTAVSVFTAAGAMGKILMLVATPMSGFVLGYVVKANGLNLNLSKKFYLAGIGALVFLYVACVGASIPFLQLLYPDWAVRSMVYVPYTTLTSLIKFIVTIMNILVIRFCKSYWQIILNGSYLVVYLIISFVLLNFYGLIGFCIGNLIAILLKFLLVLGLLIKTNSK